MHTRLAAHSMSTHMRFSMSESAPSATRRSEREQFTAWMEATYESHVEFDEARNCFKEFPVHLAWQAWRAALQEWRADFAASQSGESEGWLIEAKHNGFILWWTGGNTAWSSYNEPQWTRDAFQAARFNSKEAAQRAVALWPEWFQKEVKVTGHLFLANQCDGCQRGLPTRRSKHGTLMHDGPDTMPVMACAADRYVASSTGEKMHRPDRGDAVNLARCIVDGDVSLGAVTHGGITLLAKGLLLLDDYVRFASRIFSEHRQGLRGAKT